MFFALPSAAVVLSLVAGVAAVPPNQIPWLQSVVASATAEFKSAVTYAGPTVPIPTSLLTTHPTSAPVATYWYEQIKHQGIAAFNPDTSYVVYRNVKDYGAKGDGVTDDTAAINRAISDGDRCAPGVCQSSTTAPAVVYFPAGTYLISSSIIDYYYTQIVGNPNAMPILKATAVFSGFGLIDGDPYSPPTYGLGYGATNVFYRQIRNIIFDMTNIPASSAATGLHWPTAQATSVQNCVFLMNSDSGTQHQGIFIESGSAGFMTDVTFYGGLYGGNFGNQQYTMRNMTFYNCVTAINMLFDWGWTFKSISINNCTTGIILGSSNSPQVGSITMLDSIISNTKVGVQTPYSTAVQPPTVGSLILDNLVIQNVGVTVQGPTGPYLAGGSGTINFGDGHKYEPTGPTEFISTIKPFARPASLLSGDKFYQRSKPQYQTLPVSSFSSVRSAGAKGDGVTDDTAALQTVILSATLLGKVVFVDAGTYKVTSTIYIPPGAKIVGESYSVFMGSGIFFSNMLSPQPIVRVGLPGQVGQVEWSDMIMSTQGAAAGAILVEWNLASPSTNPSGMWDVHARIGGFAGSQLQVAQCPTTPTEVNNVNKNCIAAFMSMHVTKSATGLYLENVWLWTADHDLDDPNSTQVTVYAGRGLFIESLAGNIWLYGTAVEHHTLYQYQFVSTSNIMMGQIQTETAYYQPNPPATTPFTFSALYNDPNFATLCANATYGNCDGFAFRSVDSNLLVYGAGLYSFFDNYSTACIGSLTCQSNIVSIEGSSVVDMYNLNTIGSSAMVTLGGKEIAFGRDNVNVYPDTIALFQSQGGN